MLMFCSSVHFVFSTVTMDGIDSIGGIGCHQIKFKDITSKFITKWTLSTKEVIQFCPIVKTFLHETLTLLKSKWPTSQNKMYLIKSLWVCTVLWFCYTDNDRQLQKWMEYLHSVWKKRSSNCIYRNVLGILGWDV